MDAETEALVDGLAGRLVCRNCPAMNTRRGADLPGRRAMVATLRALLSALFPGRMGRPCAYKNPALIQCLPFTSEQRCR